MTILLAIVLVIGAVAVIVWALQSMMKYQCPECTETDSDGVVIPIIPGVRWWCPVCNRQYKKRDLVENQDDR